jgi:ATP-binding cassette subfamily F protein 2
MSGGWRMRVALAKALFARPSLLLLDEPTNHLDLETCIWLEGYLSDYPYCLVIISHSQDFLNGVCTNIVHLTPKRTLKVYTGNYDQFIKTKAEMEVQQTKQYQKEQDDIKHIKQFIASCGTFSNLVKQAKSKQKILDKMEARGLTEKVAEDVKFNFKFPNIEPLAPPVLSFIDVGFAYSGEVKDMLYRNLNLAVDMDSRIALVGPNGAGKSTLLKLITGEDGMDPTEGQLRRHLDLKLGQYSQHSNDQLEKEKTVLDFMMDSYPDKKMEVEEWRKSIGRYGISGKQQKTLIGELSDGLKSRVVFAMLAIERPNMLLFDEPTNHLDMDCIDSLAEAINEFNGGMILVSHDFRLIDQVAKTIWVCDNRTITPWKKGIRDYKKSLMRKMKFK